MLAASRCKLQPNKIKCILRQRHTLSSVIGRSALRSHMAEACKDCAKPGSFWQGTPKGTENKIGIDAYLSKPSEKSAKAVLLIPDVFEDTQEKASAGVAVNTVRSAIADVVWLAAEASPSNLRWSAANTRLLADRFAAAGFVAVLADYFHGDNPPVAELRAGNPAPFMEWRGRHGPDLVLSDVDSVLAALKEEYGVTSVGVIGFCWGGLFAAMLASGDKVNAAVINHGSFVTEKEVKAVKKPILFNASIDDKQIPVERLEEFKAILKEKSDVPSDIELFQQTHGWTVRGDENDSKLAKDIDRAYHRAEEWFKKHL